MPGPPPKPTALKLLEGNPGRRPLNTKEPQYELTKEPPDFLTDEGLVVWNQFSEQLKNTGVLTKVDVNAFGRYCDAFAVWLKLQAFVKKNGTTYPVFDYERIVHHDTQPDGSVKERVERKKIIVGAQAYPQAKQYISVSELLLKLESQFGLTPASRSKVTVGGGTSGGTEDDDFYN